MRLIFLLLCLTFTGPALAQSTPEQPLEQPSGPIAVADSANQDAAIAVRIRDILAELDGYDDVTVTVTSGIVTLRGTTLDQTHADALSTLVTRVDGVVAIVNEVSETTDVVERLSPVMERLSHRASQFLAYLPLIAIAVVAFGLIFSTGLILARMKRPWNRIAPNSFIADIYRMVVRLAFLIGGVVVALDILGATALLSTILGAAGIIGLAIGFAVRDTVENFIASIMLSIRQPFRPNDAIEINGDEGKVIRLTSRATILLSWDGNHIRIPNATVFKSRIVNYTRNAERRFLFDLCVDPETDLAQAMGLAESTVAALPFTLDTPAPNVWISDLGDSTISVRVAGWIDQTKTDLLSARSEAIRIVIAAFTAAKISMPVPTYQLLTPSDPTKLDLPEPPKPQATNANEPPATLDVEAKVEHALERIVEEEREITQQDDLLMKNGPTE